MASIVFINTDNLDTDDSVEGHATELAPHQSWIDDDHERPSWNDRLEAWRTTSGILQASGDS